jgi:4-diphosphocytidyl-2-C-methyl-D-erythritol kinase
MSAPPTRRARVRALAKINLDLRVLGKRADGYHELRTIFQTISLADSLEIAFSPGLSTAVELDDPLAIADNLVVRAARLALHAMGASGCVQMRLAKRIPMGAGLGGGSSDAAAVLLTLPVLAGRAIPLATLSALGRELGSDVPFFLLGGRAAGIGRGEELFPLPDLPSTRGLVVAPGLPVSTVEAYRSLSPRLTIELQQNKIVSFQSQVWDVSVPLSAENDFESVVFELRPELADLKNRLLQAGASPALMTGSGSAVFGLFRDASAVRRGLAALGEIPGAGSSVDSGLPHAKVFRMSLVSRSRYRSLWHSWLKEHSHGNEWPPRSLYA